MSFEQSAGMERFEGYEAELNLVKADLDQKLDQLSDMSGEQRKAAIRQAESSLQEAQELVCGSLAHRMLERGPSRCSPKQTQLTRRHPDRLHGARSLQRPHRPPPDRETTSPQLQNRH